MSCGEGGFLLSTGSMNGSSFYFSSSQGDFLANRTYGEDLHLGSWSQAIQIGPFNLLRIKSTFGEPSFFSAAVIPYLFLALEYKRRWLSAALLFCIVFSTSTSAFVALPFALLIHSLFQRKLTLAIGFVVILFVGAFATLYFVFPETYNEMFAAKFNAENVSGEIRQDTKESTNEMTKTFTVMNRVFGIGFGYFYAGVFHALLVNTGLIGIAVYLYAFLKPVIFLRSDHGGLALKVGVATLFFLFYVSVSELFLPTTWMFLGLAYWQLDRQRQQKMVPELEAVASPLPVG